ncbi:type II and III secretion system protein family protein [Polynucleobacter kasalickyi]|uniref:Pilus assembly protein CpaC n=1 Tax=Polynucleobacter kasalickyi TaxID=1938817 RepID=A0A1W1Y3U3_9BURK|nr:type II and III secretion system protein family protein [Polynucleobacter kasalickyi]SMC30870.1 pilus assembly protein CpaC [Polynucleobacter kasalickyi]
MNNISKSVISVAIANILSFSILGIHTNSYGVENRPINRVVHANFPVAIGKSAVYDLSESAYRVAVGDPSIADVRLISNKEIYVLGKKPGTTNISIWQEGSKILVLNVTVGSDTLSLRTLLDNLFPTEKSYSVSTAGDFLVLSGKISDALGVQQVVKISEEYSGKKVLNMLVTEDLPQVLIEVKVAEIDKTIANKLGIQINGSNFSFNPIGILGAASATATSNLIGSIGSTDAFLQANVQSGLVKILAEPNIVAISGQEGKFLAGGIVFLPIPQSSSTGGGSVITLQQQPYGVGVKFTPTVLRGGKINLKVAPEVSEVNPTGITVSSNGSTTVLPSINTRQASTTVQLNDGQSFAIGGLIKNNVVEVISAFPWLANVPILGALFRSSSFQNDRTELLIIVTPRIVKPLNNKPELPTDKFIQPSQNEFLFNGKLEGDPPPTKEIIREEKPNKGQVLTLPESETKSSLQSPRNVELSNDGVKK